MYNKVILMGRICNDLELKTTQNGVSVLSFRLAVDRNYQPKDAEKTADFINIVAWRSTAEFISKYFSKGRLILLEGEIQTRSYDDANGAKQWVTEVVVSQAKFTGESKRDDASAGAPPPQYVKDFVKAEATEEDYPFDF